MVFLGDLACPVEKISEFNDAIEGLDILSDEIVVLNLEAVIKEDGDSTIEKLYNHPNVLEGLQRKAKKLIVSLANNHMYDYPEEILNTKKYLENKGIGVFGLGNISGEISPYEFDCEGEKYAFFGHCWNLYTKTNPNRNNDVRVVDNNYKEFLNAVASYVQNNPNRKVYCLMHWNYDLETLPFPMHVRLSHDLIDIGVKGVIGSHSHVTQCTEIYKNCPVAYCLGNFYLPSGIFFNKQLTYPDSSKIAIGIRISGENREVLYFETDKQTPVKFLKSVTLEEHSLSAITQTKNYTKYFKKNRKKKFLVPVFKNYHGIEFGMNNFLAIQRVMGIKFIKKLIGK